MKIEACKNVKHGTIKLKAMSNSHKVWEIIFCPSQRTVDHDVSASVISHFTTLTFEEPAKSLDC